LENQPAITELFLKYLDNRCTPGEIVTLMNYFKQPGNEESIRELIRSELLEENPEADNLDDHQLILQRVRARLTEEISKSTTDKRSQVFVLPHWFRAVAFWLLITGISALLFSYYLTDIKGFFYPVRNIAVWSKVGEHKYVSLPDGSKIWLSPSSTLVYPDQFIGNLREVKLEGEAFFEIAKDKKHPFIIHSGRMATRVVGTSFEIESYPGQKRFLVTVVTGIVRVSSNSASGNKRKEVLLKPGQRGLFDPVNGDLAKTDYPDAALLTNKRNGIINCNGMPVAELVSELSGYYAIPISLQAAPANCLCYGEFDTNKPIRLVLKQLAAAIGAKITDQGDAYVITGGCAASD